MAFIYALCGPMPTDNVCPHPDIAADVNDQYGDPNFNYCSGVSEERMVQLQWMSRAFEIRISGTYQIRDTRDPVSEDFLFATKDITFDFTAASGSFVAFGPETVEERFPIGSFTPGTWQMFCSGTASGSEALAGSHEVFSDEPGYTATNYQVHYAIQLGRFAAVPASPHFLDGGTVGAAHIIDQGGGNYRIPFRVRLQFTCDIEYNPAEVPDPPYGIGATASSAIPELAGEEDYSAGGALVLNGETVELFAGLSEGIPAMSAPLTNSTPFSGEVFQGFHETFIEIRPTSLATVPSEP